tara:strand:- start:704 stop:1261 length:558 start_codon:yes stop_codon:yes gene_type:complete
MIDVAFTLLLVLTIPLLIVFFAPRLKKSYKRQEAKRSLASKHYPGVITLLTLSSSLIILFGGPLLMSIYGDKGTFGALGLALMLTLALVKTTEIITEKAKQKEAEGHDIESNKKLIKKHYPQAYVLLTQLIGGIVNFVGCFTLIMYGFPIGIVVYSVLLPVSIACEYWLDSKFYEKAKLLEGGLK